MIVMDQFTRRLIGFAIHPGELNGIAICKMFNNIIFNQTLPKYLSSDHDPLFLYHRWLAHLDILGIQQLKSIPYTPVSHPYIERLIGTIRREYLDHVLFFNDRDLLTKLECFMHYYNETRSHHALDSQTPFQKAKLSNNRNVSINKYHNFLSDNLMPLRM
jgi:transposase InsO family protein